MSKDIWEINSKNILLNNIFRPFFFPILMVDRIVSEVLQCKWKKFNKNDFKGAFNDNPQLKKKQIC